MGEQERIRRIQAGDQGCFQELAEEYYDEVYYYCCYCTGSREAAYDCTQETFLKLIRYLPTYQERQKFKGYLFSIARNVCNDYFRSQRPVSYTEDLLLEPADTRDFTEERELSWLLHGALSDLPKAQRDVIVLKYYHGFKLREIAGLLSISMAAAKSRLRQGMQKMKKALEQEVE